MAQRKYVHSSETLTFCGGALSNFFMFFMSAAEEVSVLQSCNVSVRRPLAAENQILSRLLGYEFRRIRGQDCLQFQ